MAHELAFKADGGAMMAYAGATPWHGLGTPMSANMTAAEALAAAGLGWEVGTGDVFDGDMHKIEGFKRTYRKDTGLNFGIVGENWKPIQNTELAAFAETVVGTGGANFHTAGALRKGRVVWFLLQLPKFDVVGDAMEPYFLASNGHDGGRALRGGTTTIRVVCANTLRMSDAKDAEIVIHHTKNAADRMKEAERVLSLAAVGVAKFKETAEALARKWMTEDSIREFTEGLFPLPKDEKPEETAKKHPRILKARATVAAYTGGAGLGLDREGVRGTAWAAFNAAAQWFDHDRTFRGKDDERAENRFQAVIFDEGPKFKAKALELLAK